MAADPTALPAVRDALDELAGCAAVRRLHERDPGLFAGDPAAVADRLGWLDAAAPASGWTTAIDGLVAGAAADGLTRVLLAGMGGSSLAPEVLVQVLGGGGRGLAFSLLDSTHPAAVDDATADLAGTLAIVSSKSGTTEETRSFAALLEERLADPRRLVAITDPGSRLAEDAAAAGWRAVLTNPPDIGGRYSALSLFGMVPAALGGVDPAPVWQRAGAMLQRCRDEDLQANPGAVLGAYLAGLARHGRDKLTLLAPASLQPLGDWIEQLVAESTGKQGRGIVPVVGEAVGPPEVYGDDRAFVVLTLGADRLLGVDELAAAGHPVLEIKLDDRAGLGAEFVRWEVATALAGVLLEVNPFDEPNVTESKEGTRAVLDEVAAGGQLPAPEHGDVTGLLATIAPGDYFAVMAYLPPVPAYAEPLARLRLAVRERLRVATTLGWGPRFLHSTGQLHKGGPATVVGLQVVDAATGGPAIPGRPYDFATLVRAQAAGDLRSLRAHGRRVAQVGVDGPAELDAVVETVAGLPLWTDGALP